MRALLEPESPCCCPAGQAGDGAWTAYPTRRGIVYLAAVINVASRRFFEHRVSITMEASFCVEALEEAMARYGKSEIFNTDQGSQFTSTEFPNDQLSAGIAVNMGGKGSCRDNVFVKRFWRSTKYEEVYLKTTRTSRMSDRRSQNTPIIYNCGDLIRALTNAHPIRPTSASHRRLRPSDRRSPDATTKSQSPTLNTPARDLLKIRRELTNQAKPALWVWARKYT